MLTTVSTAPATSTGLEKKATKASTRAGQRRPQRYECRSHHPGCLSSPKPQSDSSARRAWLLSLRPVAETRGRSRAAALRPCRRGTPILPDRSRACDRPVRSDGRWIRRGARGSEGSAGVPSSSSVAPAPSNCSAGVRPGIAKRRAMASWLASRMWRAKRPDSRRTGRNSVSLPSANESSGGSSERLVKLLTVSPRATSPACAVTTETGCALRRMAVRRPSAGSGVSGIEGGSCRVSGRALQSPPCHREERSDAAISVVPASAGDRHAALGMTR